MAPILFLGSLPLICTFVHSHVHIFLLVYGSGGPYFPDSGVQLGDVGSGLATVLRVIPPFALGDGLMNMTFMEVNDACHVMQII